jgi:hypothetical protein
VLLSKRTKRLARDIAQRDEWLPQREARIAFLEVTISELETMLREREASVRQREKLSETEIARREDTILEREARIAWLEGQIRRLETPRLPPCTDDLRIRLKDVATRLPGWCPEEKALWMVDHIVQNGYRTAAELGVFAGRSVFPIALAIAANQGRAVYAVDAWDNAVATSAPVSERDDIWWEAVDLIAIKSQFLREMVSQNLVSLIKIIELPIGRGVSNSFTTHREMHRLLAYRWRTLRGSGI